MFNRTKQQIHYLINNGFKYDDKNNVYIKSFDKIGYFVVNQLMNCYYVPRNPVYYSVVTIREIWDVVERVNTELDHIKINGIA